MEQKFAIFDMDGTLTDSMRYWNQLGGDFLSTHNITPPKGLFDRMKVATLLETATYFVEEMGVEGTPEGVVAEFNRIMADHYRNDVPLKPGVEEYLRRLHQRGVRMAVASATALPLVKACLERLGVAQWMEGYSSCEALGIGKEFPDVYIDAARQLGANPEECAVYEDALFAGRTAKKAGFHLVSVYDVNNRKDWPEFKEFGDEAIEDWRNAI